MNPPFSRRDVLKQAALVTGAAALGAESAIAAQGASPQPRPVSERRFRAAVRYRTGHTLQELRLLPITGRRVLIRTQAAHCCYTTVRQALGDENVAQPTVLGHNAIGVVEEVGPQAQRVRRGDRVLIGAFPQCGDCYQCVRGRPNQCQEDNSPVAFGEMQDGTQVFATTGGFSELMVVDEYSCVPIFTNLPASQLAVLGCPGGGGLAATMSWVPVAAGEDVVVMGAGPVGLSAIQGARIQGAAQIIAIEPVKSRRDVALKLGATIALDPNAEGDKLVDHVRELCSGKTDRARAGGHRGGINSGPQYTFVAVGEDKWPLKVEAGPDPTGILVSQQAFDFTATSGHIIYLGNIAYHPGKISFDATRWGNHGRTIYAGIYCGLKLRDVPRYIRLIEAGLYDTKPIADANFPLDRFKDAWLAAAERTAISAQVVFD